MIYFSVYSIRNSFSYTFLKVQFLLHIRIFRIQIAVRIVGYSIWYSDILGLNRASTDAFLIMSMYVYMYKP
jgi:hypothetical protein